MTAPTDARWPRTRSLRIDSDHPAFDGHFPGQPILPGVVLLELVIDATLREQGRVEPAAATGHIRIRQAKFHAPVGPGQSLSLSLQPTATAGELTFDLTAGELRVASGSLQIEAAPTTPTTPTPTGSAR